MKGKLFSKSKERISESEDITITKIENKPLAEYKETIYSGTPKSKKEAYAFSNQRMWRDIQAIEKNIDSIHITNAKKPTNELEKVIDILIAKKKK